MLVSGQILKRCFVLDVLGTLSKVVRQLSFKQNLSAVKLVRAVNNIETS
jgi:hypothetical protein